MSNESDKDKGNGNRVETQTSPLDHLPKIVQQIVINLHHGGRVTGTMPTDPKILMYMVGEFLKIIGPHLIYQPPSPIVIPPAGTRIKT